MPVLDASARATRDPCPLRLARLDDHVAELPALRLTPVTTRPSTMTHPPMPVPTQSPTRFRCRVPRPPATRRERPCSRRCRGRRGGRNSRGDPRHERHPGVARDVRVRRMRPRSGSMGPGEPMPIAATRLREGEALASAPSIVAMTASTRSRLLLRTASPASRARATRRATRKHPRGSSCLPGRLPPQAGREITAARPCAPRRGERERRGGIPPRWIPAVWRRVIVPVARESGVIVRGPTPTPIGTIRLLRFSGSLSVGDSTQTTDQRRHNRSCARGARALRFSPAEVFSETAKDRPRESLDGGGPGPRIPPRKRPGCLPGTFAGPHGGGERGCRTALRISGFLRTTTVARTVGTTTALTTVRATTRTIG